MLLVQLLRRKFCGGDKMSIPALIFSLPFIALRVILRCEDYNKIFFTSACDKKSLSVFYRYGYNSTSYLFQLYLYTSGFT